MIKSIEFATVLILIATRSLSCTCYSDLERRSAQPLMMAAFSFEGTIISTQITSMQEDTGSIKALFRVEKWLSPKSGADTISVYTSQSSCGHTFSKGQSWIIFANAWRGRIASDYCSGSFWKGEHSDGSLVKYFHDLIIGKHDVNIELKTYDFTYHLIGKLEDGEPVGRWAKVSGLDTLAYFNFVDGGMSGIQMEVNEDTGERHYLRLTRKGEEVEMISYDKSMKPLTSYKGKSPRIRAYWYLNYSVQSGFRNVVCSDAGDGGRAKH